MPFQEYNYFRNFPLGKKVIEQEYPNEESFFWFDRKMWFETGFNHLSFQLHPDTIYFEFGGNSVYYNGRYVYLMVGFSNGGDGRNFLFKR